MPADDPLGLGPDWFTTRPPDAVAASGPSEEPLPPEPGDGWGDDAPPLEWDGFDEGGEPAPDHTWPEATSHRAAPRLEPTDPELIAATLRRSLAAVDMHAASEVSSVAGRLAAATDLLDELPDDYRHAWDSLLEAVTFECSLLDGVGVVDLGDMPAAWFVSAAAKAQLATIKELAVNGDVPANSFVEFEALVEAHQAAKARRAALRLVEAVDARAPAAVKMQAFRDIPAPTRVRDVQNNNWSRTADEWFDVEAAALSAGPSITFSSGYPTLDLACSGTGEAPGLIRPGEFWVGGAGTGHGKSAFTRRVLTAMTQDMCTGWGIPHGRAILAFTEEEAPDVARAAMLGRGQPFHHLAHNITLAKVGESRKRLVQTVYDAVASAVRRSMETGAPVTEFLPYIFFLDYIQAIKEPGENADTEAIARTADLLMRGIAAWDHEMMASISGLDFQSYTGMAWPEGCEHHRVAVLVLSQLRKEGTNVYYREGKSSVSDFTVVDANGEPCWQPRENDYAIPDRSDLRGSGVLLNHATGLVFFHRSQPTAPLRRDASGAAIGLADTRARFIIAKARKSVAMPYVPVRFDSNPEGKRGQFYDDMGHKHCFLEGRLPLQDCYRREGDPMLPLRPSRSPFRGVAY